MEVETVQPNETQPPEPMETAPVVSNRFLFVDIAALRAKQLRRGARPRIDARDYHPNPHKAERVAMEEVRSQKVPYDLPPAKPAVKPEDSV
jgi:DNA-directed RNA polymerase subunit K/omega